MISCLVRWISVFMLTAPVFACENQSLADTSGPDFQALEKRRAFILQRLRFGTSPDLDEYRQLAPGLNQLREVIWIQNDSIRRESGISDTCRRFIRALDRNTTQLSKLTQRLQNLIALDPGLLTENGRGLYQAQPLKVARLQILSSLLTVQNQLVQTDTEAGFGILDPELEKKSCAFKARAEWKDALQRFTNDQLRASFALIGAPGLLQMGVMNDALAHETASVERSEKWRWWTAFSVEMAVSVALWKGVPQIMKLLLPALAAANVPSVYATRVLALTGEALMVKEFEESVLFVEHALLSRRSRSMEWGDMMNETERLLDAPMRSPRLYSQAISQVYANMSRQLEAILESTEYRKPTSATIQGWR